MRNDHDDDPAFDEHDILRDGATFRVPHRMLDSIGRAVRDHYAHQRGDRAGPLRVVDQFGDAGLSLRRPGYRIQAGGNQGDQLLRDGQQAEIERAYSAYDFRVSQAYLHDKDNGGDDEDEELAGHEAAIHAALSAAGGSPDDIEEYLSDIDDDKLMTGDPSYHLQNFRRRYNNQDAARRQRDRLERLYREHDAELAKEWRKGK
jgi:hypothetical protein